MTRACHLRHYSKEVVFFCSFYFTSARAHTHTHTHLDALSSFFIVPHISSVEPSTPYCRMKNRRNHSSEISFWFVLLMYRTCATNKHVLDLYHHWRKLFVHAAVLFWKPIQITSPYLGFGHFHIRIDGSIMVFHGKWKWLMIANCIMITHTNTHAHTDWNRIESI